MYALNRGKWQLRKDLLKYLKDSESHVFINTSTVYNVVSFYLLQSTRKISKIPFKVLDAPELQVSSFYDRTDRHGVSTINCTILLFLCTK